MKTNIYVVLFTLLVTSVVAKESNPCLSAETCGSCLKTNGQCYWCSDSDYKLTRCNYKHGLKGCNNIRIKDGTITLEKDDSFGSTLQVKPQVVKVTLRPDQFQSFTLSVRPAENYPMRLYYLMDMSSSMKDDKQKLSTLGQKIAKEVKNITTDFKLAFGTFVDKTVTPFIQENSKNHPCRRHEKCDATFGFKHVFNFNENAELFEEAVKQETISGNLDTPEGGFDALMQVAVCGRNIGWDNIHMARRIVLFVSDSAPHIAGDGKIGGITKPNDGKCHLSSNTPTKYMTYTKTNNLDYPSISLLKVRMKENNIVPIVAVTDDVKDIYQKIVKDWNVLGARISILREDSSNIAELIRDNYKTISTTVRLINDAPSNIVVKYKITSGCPNAKPFVDNECTGVGIKQKVDFRVSIKAVKCENNWKDTQKFNITIPGFGFVQVETNMICKCKCGGAEPNSTTCTSMGTLKCGLCNCNDGRFGKKCECDDESLADTSLCKRPNSTSDSICSGAGSCVCGKCECDKQNDPTKVVSGTYCQCNNFGCDRYDGKLCGGEERGVCKCGQCSCKERFQGENCGDINCKIGKKNCMKDGVECSGNGYCNCDQCECEVGCSGAYCQDCVSRSQCRPAEVCVLCDPHYGIGKKRVCDKCDFKILITNETQNQCSVEYSENCRVYFSISGNKTVYVESEKRCVIVIQKKLPILAIILGIIGGIVLIALLILLIGKIVLTAYDRYEYERWSQDRNKCNWKNDQNPIYRPSQQKFRNPVYNVSN